MRTLYRSALFAALLSATLSGAALSRGQYGPYSQRLHVPWSAFQPRFPGSFNASSQCCASGGYVYAVSGLPGTAAMMAPLDESVLPEGARITSVRANIRDSAPGMGDDIQVSLCRTWTEFFGQEPGGDCPYILQSSGAPGDWYLFDETATTVAYTDQLDGDFNLEDIDYSLLVDFGTGANLRQYFGSELRLYQVVITFHLQVSPPPNFGTFDDVPEDALEYPYVEALQAAGITQGCGGVNFCPDAPLTRRQFAVFLARALGLHW